MERCTLCGGKLANGKCTECGLDNTKNDKKYRLNTHNEKGALLHIGDCEDHLNRDGGWRKRLRGKHGAAAGSVQGVPRDAGRKRAKELKKRRQTGTVKGKGFKAVILIWVFVILFILTVLIGIAGYLADSGRDPLEGMPGFVRSELSGEEQEVSAPPAPASWDKSAEEYFELGLEPGFYTVGYEIPAGSYQFVCRENTADIYLEAPGEDSSYICLYSEKEQENYRDFLGQECPYFSRTETIGLEEDTVIQMGGDEPGTVLEGMAAGSKALRAHEPQSADDAVALEDGMTVGEDFGEGVYDVVLDVPEDADDYMSAYLEMRGADDSLLYMSVNSDSPRCLRVPFREGDTVHVEMYSGEGEDCAVHLAPSY